jgi:hypothetical protein
MQISLRKGRLSAAEVSEALAANPMGDRIQVMILQANG